MGGYQAIVFLLHQEQAALQPATIRWKFRVVPYVAKTKVHLL